MEEKNLKILKSVIVAAALILSVTACSSKPAEISPTPTPAVTAPASSQEPVQSPEVSPEATFIPAVPEQKISFEDSMDICQRAATKHLGAGTMILPDFDGHLIEVTFDGKTRPCYVFIGGDAMSMLSSQNQDPPARYVVDTTNGDVFDTISLKYIR